jgi:hypothetical protein
MSIRFNSIALTLYRTSRLPEDQANTQLQLQLRLKAIDRPKPSWTRRTRTLHRSHDETAKAEREETARKSKSKDNSKKRTWARKKEKKNRRCGYNTVRTTRRQILIPLLHQRAKEIGPKGSSNLYSCKEAQGNGRRCRTLGAKVDLFRFWKGGAFVYV